MKRARLGEAETGRDLRDAERMPAQQRLGQRAAQLVDCREALPFAARRRRSVAGVVPRRTASVSKSGHSAAGSAFNCARVFATQPVSCR